MYPTYCNGWYEGTIFFSISRWNLWRRVCSTIVFSRRKSIRLILLVPHIRLSPLACLPTHCISFVSIARVYICHCSLNKVIQGNCGLIKVFSDFIKLQIQCKTEESFISVQYGHGSYSIKIYWIEILKYHVIQKIIHLCPRWRSKLFNYEGVRTNYMELVEQYGNSKREFQVKIKSRNGDLLKFVSLWCVIINQVSMCPCQYVEQRTSSILSKWQCILYGSTMSKHISKYCERGSLILGRFSVAASTFVCVPIKPTELSLPPVCSFLLATLLVFWVSNVLPCLGYSLDG